MIRRIIKGLYIGRIGKKDLYIEQCDDLHVHIIIINLYLGHSVHLDTYK